jgi:glycosyltransferase involved in cell wall biosynthesis
MALKLISRAPYRHKLGTIPVVCPIKNERNLLPHFIHHHRKLGIECFIFVDNDSDDGSTEYLLEQPDAIVYHTNESYAQSRFAADWVSELLNSHALGEWGIYLDCDELLVYEDMETTSFSRYLHTYAIKGVDSFYALMIDIYPEGSWSGVSARTSSFLLTDISCFDKDYVIRRPPKRPWVSLHHDAIEVLGGPRCRLFSTLEQDMQRGWMHYAVAGQVDRFVNFIPISLMPILAAVWPRTQQAFFKTPANLIRDGFRYGYSHESSNHNKAGVMLGILHLKFCDELNARFDPVFSYRNHYQHGLERFQLARALRRWRRDTLVYSGTRHFECSRDLARYGLIGERPAVVWSEGAEFFCTGQDANANLDAELTKSNGHNSMSRREIASMLNDQIVCDCKIR